MKKELIGQWAILFLITVSLIIVFSIAYPALNWPDETYKISTLYTSENLYLRTLDWLQGGNCGFHYTSVSNAIYGSNRFEFQILSGQDCYRNIKFLNAILIIAIIVFCLPFIRAEKWKIFFMALMWPSGIFFLTSVNNQVVFQVISIALGVYGLYARSLLIPIFLSLVLIAVDRSFITTLIFFSILQSFRINVKLTIIGFIALILFSQLTGELLENLYSSLVGADETSLSQITESTEDLRDSIFFSFALLGVSFVYLGGTASVFGIGLDYLLVFSYLAKRIFAIEDKAQLLKIMASFVFTFLLVVQFVPSIQSFRYYIFIMPYLIFYFLKSEHYKYYIVYCIVMATIYLLLAYYLQGAVF